MQAIVPLQLRYLQTLNSISAEHNSTIIFPMPIRLIIIIYAIIIFTITIIIIIIIMTIIIIIIIKQTS